MALKNCEKCGKIFAGESFNRICEKCSEKDDMAYKLVKDYMYDHPEASISEVAKFTLVEEERIYHYLRQAKLKIRGNSVSIDCERCGASISAGRFCEKCTYEMSKGFKEAFGQANQSGSTSKNNEGKSASGFKTKR